jgi:hypothetical protein
MGEPVLDRNANRLNRTIQRAMNVDVNRRLYGETLTRTAIARIRSLAMRYPADLPGTVIYDVDPVAFDEFIEIRTGGDRSVLVVTAYDAYQWLSFWPLASMTDDEVLEAWDGHLRTMEEPHVVLAEVDSLLEQSLTFDFGYQAVRRDQAEGRWRFMTHPRFVEALRADRRVEIPAVESYPRYYLNEEQPPRYVFNNSASSLYTDGSTTASSTLGVPARAWRQAFEAADTVTTSSPGFTTPLPARHGIDLLIAPEGSFDPDVDEWRADHPVTAWNGRPVMVNQAGLDERGYDPHGAFYEPGLCNCEDCRVQRMTEANAAEPDDEPWDDEDYDDPPEDADYIEEEEE